MPPLALNAVLNLRLASGAAAQLQNDVQRSVGGLGGVVDVKVAPRAVAQLGQAALGLGRVRAEAAATTSALTSLGRQAAAAGLGIGVLGPAVGRVSSVFRAAADEAVAFDDRLNKLLQTTDEGAAGVRSLRAEISRLSTSLGVSSKDLADQALVLAQAGLKASEAKTALEALGKAALAPNFSSAKQTAEGAIAVYQQFGRDVTKLKGQLGAMNSIAGATATEAGDLVTAVQKAGGAFSSAGGKLEELLGLFSSVRATTRESADEVSSGIRSILSYVQRSDTVEHLKDLGIQLRYTREEARALGDVGLTDQFVGPYKAVQRLSEGLAKLRSTDPRYSQVVEELGGVRQVSRVIPLIQQFADAQKALNIARLGGSSLDIAAEQRQDALANKLEKVKERWLDVVHSFTESHGIQAFVGLLTKAGDAAANLAEQLTPLVPLAVTFGALRVGSWAGSTAAKLVTRPRLGFATGGVVPGHGRGDVIPAALEPGEFVVRRDAARAIGYDRLRHLNQYARGGVVAPLSPAATVKAGVDPFDAIHDFTPSQRDAFFRHYGLLDEVGAKVGPSRGSLGAALTTLRSAGLDEVAVKLGLVRGVQKLDPSVNAGKPHAAAAERAFLRRSIEQTILDMSKTAAAKAASKTFGADALHGIASRGADNASPAGPKPQFTKDFLEREYWKLGKSPWQIAEETGSYANAVRRALLKHWGNLRDKGRAQANALKTGRAIHPKAGKPAAETIPDWFAGRRPLEDEPLARLFEEIQAAQPSPTPRLAEIVKRYINDSAAFNDPLLAGQRPAGAAGALAKFVRAAKLPSAITAYRGLSDVALRDLIKVVGASPFSKDAVDRTFTWPSFLSTTLSTSTADEYDKVGRLTVHLPEGYPAAAIGRATRGSYGQSEILLPPGRRFRVTAPGVFQAFRTGGLVGESQRNLLLARQALLDIGLPSLDLGKLVSGLHVVRPEVLGRHALGEYAPATGTALIRAGAKLPTIAHEILGHAASAKAAELNLARDIRGPSYASSIPGSPFQEVGLQSLQHLLPAAMSPETLLRYVRAYEGRPELLLEEAAAWGIEGFVHDRWAKAGRGPLPKSVQRAYESSEVRSLFGTVEQSVLPELKRLTGRQQWPAYPGDPEEVDRLVRRIDGKTVRPRKFAAGGLVPGPAGDWTDSVPVDLPVGSFVLRKAAVRAIGPSLLQRLRGPTARLLLKGGLALGSMLTESAARDANAAYEQVAGGRVSEGAARSTDLARALSRKRFASGGSVAARVMPGEFVFGPDDAARIGLPTLNAMNRVGFAAGGWVGRYRLQDEFKDSPPLPLAPTPLPSPYGAAPIPFPNNSDPVARSRVAAERLIAETRVASARYAADAAAARPGYEFEAAGLTTVGGRSLLLDRTRRAVSTAGGPDALSAETQAVIATKERTQAEQELAKAIRQQLKALYPAVGATENELKARELAAEALTQNAKVLRAANGKVAGLESLGAQLAAQGGPVRGVRGGVRAPVGGLSLRATLSSLLAPERATTAAIGLTAIAPFVASRIGPDQKEAEAVARSGQGTRSYTVRSAAAGGLEGAAVGAAAGLAFGPIGAAVGGVVGGLAGFTAALHGATEALLSAKVEADVGALAPRLESLAKGGSPADLAAATRLIRQSRENIDQRAAQGATDTVLGFGYATDANKLSALRRSETLRSYGPSSTTLVAALNEQASGLGRQNPNADPARLTSQFAALNKDLIGVLAAVRGESTKETSRSFEELVRSAQKAALAKADGDRLADLSQRTATAFGRLGDATQKAADGLARLDQRAAVLGGLFDASPAQTGVAKEGSVTAESFGRFAGVYGPQGASLLAHLSAGEDLGRVLPSALSAAAAANPTDGPGFAQRVRDAVRDALGGRLTEGQSRGLDQAVDVLARRDLPDVLRSVRADVTKLADELRGAADGPAREQAGRLFDQATARGQVLVEGLNAYGHRRQTLGEQQDVVADLGLARQRFVAEQAVQNGFAPSAVLGLNDLLAPFRSRQTRLLAGTGLDADDANGIAARLGAADHQVAAATAARDQAVGTPKFLDAAQNLARLTSAAGDLQQALKNLADPTQRAAAIQEKLNQLAADRDSRLGYAEKYVFADPDERLRLARGQALAAQLNLRPAGFDALSDDDRRLALQATRDIGSAKFANGRTGEGLRVELLRRTGVLNPGDERERNDLAARGAGVFEEAARAQSLLVDRQSQLQATFFQTLTQQHEQFFARLGVGLRANALTDLQVKQGEAGRRLGELRGQSSGAALLAQAGVTTDDQLARLQARRADVQNYAVANQRVAELEAARRTVTSRLGRPDGFAGLDLTGENTDFSFWSANRRGPEGAKLQRGTIEKAQKFLTEQFSDALTPEQAGRVLGRFQTEGYDSARAAYSTAKSNSTDPAEAVKKALQFSLQAAITTELGRESQKSADERTRLRQSLAPVGLNAAGFDQAVGASGGAAFLKALEQFDSKANPIASFGDRLKAATAEFEQLTKAVGAMRAVVEAGGPVVHRAKGGPVWSPRGTDTIPAMLSPNEFIVNSKSATANAGLLNQINAARGPVHLAEGGFVSLPGGGSVFQPPLNDQLEETNRRAKGRAIAEAQAEAARTRIADRTTAYERAADPNSAAGLDALGVGVDARTAAAVKSGRLDPKLRGVYGASLLDSADSARTAQSLLYQQALAGAAGDDDAEQYQSAVGRVAKQEQSDYKRFRQRFGPQILAAQTAYLKDLTGKRNLNKAVALRRFAAGGVVPGYGNRDSVLAALTPGEVVMNKGAVQAVGAGPLLALNRAAKFADGGLVVGGGTPSGGGGFGLSPEAAQAMQQFAAESAKLGESLGGFAAPAQSLAAALGGFGGTADKLIAAIEKMPTSVEHTGKFDVSVVVTGADALQALGEPLKRMIEAKAAEAASIEVNRRFPESSGGGRGDASRI